MYETNLRYADIKNSIKLFSEMSNFYLGANNRCILRQTQPYNNRTKQVSFRLEISLEPLAA